MNTSNELRPACPMCNSSNVATILWGMPAYSEDLARELKGGRVFLGGCCPVSDAPTWHCNDCDHNWAADQGERD